MAHFIGYNENDTPTTTTGTGLEQVTLTDVVSKVQLGKTYLLIGTCVSSFDSGTGKNRVGLVVDSVAVWKDFKTKLRDITTEERSMPVFAIIEPFDTGDIADWESFSLFHGAVP